MSKVRTRLHLFAGFSLFCALYGLLSAAFAQQRVYAYEELNLQFPDAQLTIPTGRNSKGEVVGIYADQAGQQFGFLYSAGSFYSIPAGVGGVPRSINENSEVAGWLVDSSSRTRGFLFRNGVLEMVDVPGNTQTLVFGISDAGHFTGFYVTDESPATTIPFVMQDGHVTLVDVPGSVFTNPIAVNANGEVVGVSQDADGTYSGFHWRNGVSTTFTMPGPGGNLTTQANGINNSGVIAGVRLNMAQESSGFVYANGEFSRVHVPGTPGESAVAINGRGEILGESYVPDGRHHAFVAYPAMSVAIDVMPGDLSNTIHLTSNEKVRVAILSSSTFDATTIDPLSVSFAGASLRVVGGKAKPKVWTKDLGRDGRLDLLLEFEVSELQLTASETLVVLHARTFNGAYVVGSDAVHVIP